MTDGLSYLGLRVECLEKNERARVKPKFGKCETEKKEPSGEKK